MLISILSQITLGEGNATECTNGECEDEDEEKEDECNSDSECNSDEQCTNGECIDKDECTDDSQCPEGKCFNGECFNGTVLNDTLINGFFGISGKNFLGTLDFIELFAKDRLELSSKEDIEIESEFIGIGGEDIEIVGNDIQIGDGKNIRMKSDEVGIEGNNIDLSTINGEISITDNKIIISSKNHVFIEGKGEVEIGGEIFKIEGNDVEIKANEIRLGPSDISSPFIITNKGNVGIGVMSPTLALDVFNANTQKHAAAAFSSNNPATWIAFQSAGTTGDLPQIGVIGNMLQLQTSGTGQLSITPEGNVGIGMSTPNAKLYVEGSRGGYGIISQGANVGIFGYGINGMGIFGYGANWGGFFQNSKNPKNFCYLGGEGYSLYCKGDVYLEGKVDIKGKLSVAGSLYVNGKLIK